MPLERGDRIERYVIEARIGAGGMGEVYRAHDERLERRVALKILRPPTRDDENARSTGGAERMLREARAAAQLDHPNVVAIFDVGTVNEPEELRGTTYLAMELITGVALRGLIGDDRVTVAERVRWITDIARALATAHRAGIVHRDIKPENVMVRDDGLVKVLDFGIAKRATPASPHALSSTEPFGTQLTTGAGVIVGTPMYMAPEQLRAEQLDGRADQFAWGVLAYELLAGKNPWSLEAGAVGLVAQILSATPEPLPSSLPTAVVRAVTKAMAKDRPQRFATMDDVILALGETVPTLPAASKDATPPPRTTETPDPLSASRRLDAEIASASDRRPKTRAMIFAATVVAALAGGTALVRYARVRVESPASPAPARGSGCASNRACTADGGAPAICRASDGACVPLASVDCRVRAEPGDLARDDTVWIGSLYPLTGPDADVYGLREAETVDLARMDFAQAMGRFTSPDAANAARPLALVSCDDAADPARAARHLVEDLHVPAVIGIHRAADAIDLAASLFLPNRTLLVAPLATSPLLTRLPEPAGPRLVWRTTYDATQTTAPIAELLARIIEPGVHGPIRVALLRDDDAGAAAFSDSLFRRLRFNGKSALENGGDYRELVLGTKPAEEIVHELLRLAPSMIVYSGRADVVKDVIVPLEEAWPASHPRRPTYVAPTVLAPSVFEFAGTSASRRRRFFGLTNVSTTLVNARLVMHYGEAFRRPMTRTNSANSSYDAFYIVAYASYAAGNDAITGTSLGRGIEKLLPPGKTIDVGPAQIYDAFSALRAGEHIDLNGSIGRLDFDPATGNALVDQAILCVSVDDRGRASGLVESGLEYDFADARLDGTMHCP